MRMLLSPGFAVMLLFATPAPARAIGPPPLCERFVPTYPTDGAVDVPLNTFLVGRIEQRCPTYDGAERTGLTLFASDHQLTSERLAGQYIPRIMLRPSTTYTLTATVVVDGTPMAQTSTAITFRTGESLATAPSLEGVRVEVQRLGELRRGVDGDEADLVAIEVELDTPSGTPPFALLANWGPNVASVRTGPPGGPAAEVLLGGRTARTTFIVGPSSQWNADEVCVQLRTASNDFSQVPCQSEVDACVEVVEETIVCRPTPPGCSCATTPEDQHGLDVAAFVVLLGVIRRFSRRRRTDDRRNKSLP